MKREKKVLKNGANVKRPDYMKDKNDYIEAASKSSFPRTLEAVWKLPCSKLIAST